MSASTRGEVRGWRVPRPTASIVCGLCGVRATPNKESFCVTSSPTLARLQTDVLIFDLRPLKSRTSRRVSGESGSGRGEDWGDVDDRTERKTCKSRAGVGRVWWCAIWMTCLCACQSASVWRHVQGRPWVLLVVKAGRDKQRPEGEQCLQSPWSEGAGSDCALLPTVICCQWTWRRGRWTPGKSCAWRVCEITIYCSRLSSLTVERNFCRPASNASCIICKTNKKKKLQCRANFSLWWTDSGGQCLPAVCSIATGPEVAM